MIKYTTLVCPGAGAETSVYRLQLRLWPKVSAPAGSGSATLEKKSEIAIQRADISNLSHYSDDVFRSNN
jgi:hypothetical protein